VVVRGSSFCPAGAEFFFKAISRPRCMAGRIPYSPKTQADANNSNAGEDGYRRGGQLGKSES